MSITLKPTNNLDHYKAAPDIDRVGTHFNRDIHGQAYRILLNNKEIGFITGNYGKKGTDKNPAFASVYILPKYRGKGYINQAEDELAKILKIKKLMLTIKKNNLPSMRSAVKGGFEIDPNSKRWVAMGRLDKESVRYIKKYAEIKPINFPARYKQAILNQTKNQTIRVSNELGKYKIGKIYAARSYDGQDWSTGIRVTSVRRVQINNLPKALSNYKDLQGKYAEIVRFEYV